MTGPGKHSPVGMSRLHQLEHCPDAAYITQGLQDGDSDHSATGTLAHAVAETCLRTGSDAWEFADMRADEDVLVTPDMAVAVQKYLDAIRSRHPEFNQGNSGIEKELSCPSIHVLCYSTCDFYFLTEIPMSHGRTEYELDVWDYKNGAGVVVEVEGNPQVMGYGAMVAETLDVWSGLRSVTFHIVQPNAWHVDGYHREWSIAGIDLEAWVHGSLIPLLDRSGRRFLEPDWQDLDAHPLELAAGDWCRFCEARGRACPAILSTMERLEQMIPEIEGKPAHELTDEQVGEFAGLIEVAKIVGKANDQTVFERLMAGKRIKNRKLVNARAFRKYKDGAKDAALKKFGVKAIEPAEVKSPAQIEKLPGGTAFCAEWAYKPDAGLTVAPMTDPRKEVSRNTQSLFTPVKK